MAGSPDDAILDALQRVRVLTETQLPSLNLPPRELDPSTLQRFSESLPREHSDADAQRLRAEIERLSPWLQGPFYLGGDIVIEGPVAQRRPLGGDRRARPRRLGKAGAGRRVQRRL